MARFNEAQLEQAFVEFFKQEGYEYVYGDSILRDSRDVLLYDDLRAYLCERYSDITNDEVNRAIAKLETSEGGGVYAENVEALRLIQDGFSLKRTDPRLPNLHNELDVIRRLFNTFRWSDYFTGSPLEQLNVLQKAAEFIQRTKELETQFMRHCKKLKGAYDICCNSEQLTADEDNDIHFFLAVRAIISKLTRGNAPDAVRMNKRVGEMLKDALMSDAVEEIAKIGVAEDEEIDLLSSEYMRRLDQIPYKNTKVKLMEQLLKQVIESLRKINKQKGVDFTKRLEEIVRKYNDRSDDAALANDVIDEGQEPCAHVYERLD